jgi:ribokinase
MARVWIIGSLNIDRPWRVVRHPTVGETVVGEQLAPMPGGKGLNQAVAAARTGVDVGLVGCVGDDEDGAFLRGVAAAEGIDVAGVARSAEAPTGSALIVIDDAGANTVTVAAGANRVLEIGVLPLAPGDVVVAQLEVPVAAVVEAFRQARAVGAVTMLNPSPVGESGDLLVLADVLVVNELEAAALGLDPPSVCTDAQQATRGAYRTEGGVGATVVVTLGAGGCAAAGSMVAPKGLEGGVVRVAGVAAEVVDTTGAGDCFLGVLAAGLAAGRPFVDAVERANQAAALAVTRLGTVAAMPTAAEIDAVSR